MQHVIIIYNDHLSSDGGTADNGWCTPMLVVLMVSDVWLRVSRWCVVVRITFRVKVQVLIVIYICCVSIILRVSFLHFNNLAPPYTQEFKSSRDSIELRCTASERQTGLSRAYIIGSTLNPVLN